MKVRIDKLIMDRELLDSLNKTRSFIMQGKVYVDNEKVDKAGHNVDVNSHIEIRGYEDKYVSRGGYKLEKALGKFDLSIEGLNAIDIGASTGGFTDCLLQNGVKKVYAIDVGYGQLAWKLRQDNRVKVMERTNIRYVTKDDIDDEIGIISADVSFISLDLVLPVIDDLLSEDGKAILLIKPQFEAEREDVGDKGIIRDKGTHNYVLENMIKSIEKLGFRVDDLTFSPITGATGNIEFLALIRKVKDGDNKANLNIKGLVDKAHDQLC